nr:isochorismatase family protein [Brucella intermedia]
MFFPPQPEEIVIRKTKDNGFDGTDLDVTLKRLGVRTLAMAGTLSEMCLGATARAAMELGYGVLLPHDAHATYDVSAGPGSDGVPAAMAARAAEWSLGDEKRRVELSEAVPEYIKIQWYMTHFPGRLIETLESGQLSSKAKSQIDEIRLE